MARTPAVTFAAAAALLLSVLLLLLAGSSSSPPGLLPLRAPPLEGRRCCKLQFQGYTPSAWELEWADEIEEVARSPSRVCQKLRQDSAQVGSWLAAAAGGGRRAAGGLQLRSEVLSQLDYREPCTGELFSAFIEPLAGHFRHPYTPKPCLPRGKENPGIESRDYLVLGGLPQGQLQRAYPGRHYLLDLGTARFPSSLGWLVERYTRMGLGFDDIWAWELKGLPPQEYWAEVPGALQPRLHFYNTGVPISNASDPANPLNIIRGLYQAGDFVALKLDIDNSGLELALIDQILGDPQMPSMLGELFFEMHYRHPDMQPYFGKPDKDWGEVMRLLTQLRSAGVRVHYWP